MEILSTSYNCRNRFVAGFISPMILDQLEDQLDSSSNQQTKSTNKKKNKSNKNFNILLTNNNLIELSSFNSPNSTVYKIDVSKLVCPITMYSSKLNNQTNDTLTIHTTIKGKNALRNRKKKEAIKRKRELRNKKHVHFPSSDQIAVIIILDENDETREYRNKYWENFVIDRHRFQHRISKLVDTLNKILDTSHRNKIFKERFDCSDDSGNENDSDKDLNIIEIKSKLDNIKIDSNIDENNTSESGFEQEEEIKTEDEEESESEYNLPLNTDNEDSDDDLVCFSITTHQIDFRNY